MNPALLRIMGIGLIFLITFVSGYQLHQSGKPYNTIIFNIHKLIGLVALVLFIITIYNVYQLDGLNPMEIFICIITGLFFLIAIISGGLASIYETIPTTISILHKISPYLSVLFVAVTLYIVLYN